MKNRKKYISEKVTMKFDWFELYDLKICIKNEILTSIRIDKYLGLKFPFYNSDKNLVRIYKEIVKQIKKY